MAYPKRSWLALGLGVPGWICVTGVVVGLAIGGVGIATLQQGWALAVAGVDTTGRITRLNSSTYTCNNDSAETCTSYEVGYSFEAAGREMSGNASVSSGFFGGLVVGQSQPVRYVAANPAVNEIDIGITLIAAVCQAVLALVVTLGAAGFLAWRMRAAQRMVRLRDEGVMRTAEVLTRAPNHVKVNNVPQYVITWRDSSGATGKSRGRRQENLPAPGDRITVYADPAGAFPAVWEGDSGTR